MMRRTSVDHELPSNVPLPRAPHHHSLLCSPCLIKAETAKAELRPRTLGRFPTSYTTCVHAFSSYGTAHDLAMPRRLGSTDFAATPNP
ncbi:hypothetical protein BST61_g11222 [Cercospora zeina]